MDSGAALEDPPTGSTSVGRRGPRSSRSFGVLIVVASSAVFSFSSLVFRRVDAATDWQFLTWRAFSAAAAMVMWLAVRHRGRVLRPVVTMGPIAWLASLCLAGSFTLFILSIARISVATTFFLQAAAPINAALIAWLFLSERVRRQTWIAIGISLIGIVIMVGTGIGTEDSVGLMLAVGLSVLLGMLSVALRAAGDVDPAAVPFVGAFLAGCFAAAMALRAGSVLPSSHDILLACIAGGVILGIGLPLFTLGHRHVPAAEVMLLLLVEVVLSPIWVWLWANERPTNSTLLGGAIILSAVVYLARSSAKESAATASMMKQPGAAQLE